MLRTHIQIQTQWPPTVIPVTVRQEAETRVLEAGVSKQGGAEIQARERSCSKSRRHLRIDTQDCVFNLHNTDIHRHTDRNTGTHVHEQIQIYF